MNTFQFSLRALLAAVGFAAIGTACLTSLSNPMSRGQVLWNGLMIETALAMFAFAAGTFCHSSGRYACLITAVTLPVMLLILFELIRGMVC